MYQKRENQILLPHEFFLPFEGRLNENNRWCQLALLIPWGRIEDEYAKLFKPISIGGETAVSVRTALGALLIQENSDPVTEIRWRASARIRICST